MTDSEIKKAFEHCFINNGKCKECPLYVYGAKCRDVLSHKNIFDIINRQKAEIERLKTENEGYKRLEIILNTAVDKLAANIKSEAIKEFAERLKKRIGDKHFENYGYALLEIIELAQEMTEDTE